VNSELDRLESTLKGALASECEREWLPRPEAVTVTVLAVGTYHTNFLVQSVDAVFVARYNRLSQWDLSPRNQLEREFATLRDLTASGVTPIPLALLDGDEPFLLESYIPGSAFHYAADTPACAIAIAQAHACAPQSTLGLLSATSPFEFLLDDGESWLDRAVRVDGAVGFYGAAESTTILRRTHDRLAEASPVIFDAPNIIVHTDLIQSNILRTETGCALVDWEGARIGPRAWDLAYFLSPVTAQWALPRAELGASHRDDFIRVYAEKSGIDPVQLDAEVSQLMPYVMFRALCWCAERLYSGEETKLDSSETLELVVSPQFLTERFGALLA
jgi:aminoglycoside phosphotransferase (APT) family kinase protein